MSKKQDTEEKYVECTVFTAERRTALTGHALVDPGASVCGSEWVCYCTFVKTRNIPICVCVLTFFIFTAVPTARTTNG